MFDPMLRPPYLRALLVVVLIGPLVYGIWRSCVVCTVGLLVFPAWIVMLPAIPALLLLQHYRATSAWVFCFAGGVTAVAAMATLLLIGKFSSIAHISTYARDALDGFFWGAVYGLVVWLVVKPRPWQWIIAITIACGQRFFPSATALEWTALVVAVVGLFLPFLPRIAIESADLLSALGAGVFFTLFGLIVRLLNNGLNVADALLLERGVGPFFGFMHHLGYWMLAALAAASLSLFLRSRLVANRHGFPR